MHGYAGARLFKLSFSRTCAGVISLAPRFSTRVAAFSTSCALVANSPLRSHILSSRPTRTFPPASIAVAT